MQGAARRETFEETHLRAARMVPFDTFLLERTPDNFLHGVAFIAVAAPGRLQLSPEHDASTWVTKEQLLGTGTPRLAVGVQETVRTLLARWDFLLPMLKEG